MSEVSTDKKLKGKDLITIGIFSAIYFVINFAFMLLGGIHPVLWMLMPGFIAVFAGIPFMLMVAKVQKPGAVFLMGLITALIYFATGQFTLVILISMASTCILAEVVRAVTKYNSFKGNSIVIIVDTDKITIFSMKRHWHTEITNILLNKRTGAVIRLKITPEKTFSHSNFIG